MKIILTENQLKDNLIQLIKSEGWIGTFQMLGLSGEELAKMFFNDYPMDFLNIYNDLNVVENIDYIFFKDTKDKDVFICYKNLNYLEVANNIIWNPLRFSFKITDTMIQELLNKWLKETFNLNVPPSNIHRVF